MAEINSWQLLNKENEQKAEFMRRMEDGLSRATPVPSSFEEAVKYAATGALTAIQAGVVRQSMYFNTAGEDLSTEALEFAEDLAKMFASIDTLGSIKVYFSSRSIATTSASQWEPLSSDLDLDYLVEEAGTSDTPQRVLEVSPETSLLLVVAPEESTLQALSSLFDAVKDVPIVVINGPQTLLEKEALTPTFHLHHVQPATEDPPVNPGIVARMWPKPFSLWEDNPEDPFAVNGFNLVHLSMDKAPQKIIIDSMLEKALRMFKAKSQWS